MLAAAGMVTVLFLALFAAAYRLDRRSRPAPSGQRVGMTAGIDPTVPPSGTGCADCDEVGGWWVHLRRCARAGTSAAATPPRAARHRPLPATGHPVVQSFEPGEDWFWDYGREVGVVGSVLAEPTSHPADQPTPGPAGRVPENWRDWCAERYARVWVSSRRSPSRTSRPSAPLTTGRNGWTWPHSTSSTTGTPSPPRASATASRWVIRSASGRGSGR